MRPNFVPVLRLFCDANEGTGGLGKSETTGREGVFCVSTYSRRPLGKETVVSPNISFPFNLYTGSGSRQETRVFFFSLFLVLLGHHLRGLLDHRGFEGGKQRQGGGGRLSAVGSVTRTVIVTTIRITRCG